MPNRPRFAALLLLTIFGLSTAAVRGEEPSVPVADQLPSLDLLKGPWEGGTINREGLMFVKGKDGPPSAKLLYDARRILSVHSADGLKPFKSGEDYQLTPDGSALVLIGSRIPFINESDLFRPKGAPNSIGHRAGHADISVLFDNGHWFHDMQVEVTYEPREARWTGERPAFAGDRLKNTLAKLKAKKALKLAVSGDSISQGYNASAFSKTAPFMPPYPDLVAAQLRKTYGADVKLDNLAISGWSVSQGVKDFDRLLKLEPDLIIIAYGMNDVGGRDPVGFKAQVETMLRKAKETNPSTDVILVAGMTGNPDWFATPAEMFPKYREALASLEGPGVVLADLTSVWLKVLERKRFTDLNGNGVNHPNDYGHRLYAQAILSLLIPRPTSD